MPGFVGADVNELRALGRRGGGVTPWLLPPGGGFPDAGATPVLPSGDNAAGPRWSFPNPYHEYRDFVGDTPIWPISVGNAVGVTPPGAATKYADDAELACDDRLGMWGSEPQVGFDGRGSARYLSGAASPWGDVASESAAAAFGHANVGHNVYLTTVPPAEAFDAARDAVLDRIPQLVSMFSFNPFGKVIC